MKTEATSKTFFKLKSLRQNCANVFASSFWKIKTGVDNVQTNRHTNIQRYLKTSKHIDILNIVAILHWKFELICKHKRSVDRNLSFVFFSVFEIIDAHG
jgi:hypothetical protein